jgi:hypothetical protein
MQRLKGSQNGPIVQPGGPGSILNRGEGDPQSAVNAIKGGKDKDCVIMWAKCWSIKLGEDGPLEVSLGRSDV